MQTKFYMYFYNIVNPKISSENGVLIGSKKQFFYLQFTN